MAEDKPGFFKRLFKFGKKGSEEEEAAKAAQAEAEKQAQEQAREQAAEEAQSRVEAELRAAEEEVRRKAEQAEAEERAKAEALAAVEAAAVVAKKAQEEAAKQRKQEQDAAAKAALEKQAADEQAVRQKAETEEAAQKLEREKQAAALAERVKLKAAERAEAEALAKKQLEEVEKQAAAQKAEEEKVRQARFEKEKEEAEAARLLAEKEAAGKAAAEEAERLAAEAEAEFREQERIAAGEEAARQAGETHPEPTSPPRIDQTEQSTEPDAGGKKSWFSRLRDGLSRSSSQLSENITAVFTKRKLDDDTLQELEDILIQADLGVDTAMNITDALANQRMGKDITDTEVREFMADEIEKVLDPVAAELELDLDHTPHVILVVGVNGSGKTTTIGKLSQKLYDAGFSTLLVAGDTFRAAAIEQLKIWGERTQSPVVFRPLGSDAAGLAYDAYARALDEGRDVMLMDTAGRLQNKKELMAELEKIVRVLKKQDPTAPHTVLLTLDATTGQNALSQVEIFKDIAGVNGLVMTKLDGTARGGIMVAIASKFKLPVYFIGVGEQVDDLEPFEARDFARSIAGLEN